MREPEVEPGAQTGTLASQCEHGETADDVNRDTDGPQSPNPTNEVAVAETELEDKGTENLAGEWGTIAEKVALGKETVEVGAMAGDANPSVKEEEEAEVAGPTVEMGPSVETSQLIETGALHEAVIAGTDEVSKEEGSQIDHAVKRGEENYDRKEEVGPVVETGSFCEAGAVGEAVIAGSDDIMPKEEEEVEQEVELTDETETKEEDFIQTGQEAPHMDKEMVHPETNNEGTDGLQSEDNNPTQDEETNMDEESMHDDDGGDKAMDEDLMEDGGGDKAMDEVAMGVDDDGGGEDEVAKHGDEVMGMNDGEEDDPPPLPAKRTSGGRKKRGRPPRIKKGEEELCFICFDGGELVVCDRRSVY